MFTLTVSMLLVHLLLHHLRLVILPVMMAILRPGRLCLLITCLLRQHCLWIQGLADYIQFMVLLLHLHVQLHRIVGYVCSCAVTVPSSGLVIASVAVFQCLSSLLPCSSVSCLLHYCFFFFFRTRCSIFDSFGLLLGSWPRRSYFGAPHHVCKRCGACFWYRERNKSLSTSKEIVYTGCCRGGKVSLPVYPDWPSPLSELLRFDGDAQCNKFMRLIREYNSMFAFTSLGVHVDQSANVGSGPYVFKICGVVCHEIGSLLPPGDNPIPKFAQLYIYDTQNELDHRMGILAPEDDDDAADLSAPVEQPSSSSRGYRRRRDSRSDLDSVAASGRSRMFSPNAPEVGIRLFGHEGTEHGNRYSLPTTPELAALIVGDLDTERCRFDVIVQKHAGPLQRVSPLNPSLMSLQYPLLFPYGSMGDKLRSETYQGITDALGEGNSIGKNVGVEYLLHSSFTGSPRYMIQNYHDGMAICRVFGAPDLFITFTCNPKWDEISVALLMEPGQTHPDRPDIVTRVFKMKINQFTSNVRKGKAFGPVNAYLYVVEFQKRGLPHIHALVWLKVDTEDPTPGMINSYISAEIPDCSVDPLGYALVEEFMVHGPCGEYNPKAPCMKDGACSKRYPKDFNEETTIDGFGFPIASSVQDRAEAIPTEYLYARLLQELSIMFGKNGYSLQSFNISTDSILSGRSLGNRLLLEEMQYDRYALTDQAASLCSKLNQEQIGIYEQIMAAVTATTGKVFFVSGHGGTGKTFLWSAIITALRADDHIVLAVASSGVASLLLPGGRTAHSRFRIPVEIDERTMCNIPRGTNVAQLVHKASLILWDEAPMTHRRCFEAVDRSMRDVMSVNDTSRSQLPFGGKTVVLGGDFRQVLPVVEGGSRFEVLDSSLIRSPLWQHVTVLTLRRNMRLSNPALSAAELADLESFAQWVLSVGNGTVPMVARDEEAIPSWISLPPDITLLPESDYQSAIVHAIYDSFHQRC
ncbi:uncharacterized protein [Lolium perenne]|uniref:uncharacterized protein n=1 Tax=Lolium perenne TaxID=4522 RepID=UPI003A999962